ncbi:MAG: hypothetical protein ACI9Y1_002286 [Lentisphaeria bacterium]|jgi:hypothetical protein
MKTNPLSVRPIVELLLNNMKSFGVRACTATALLAALCVSVDVSAEARVNSKESLRVCKSAIEADAREGQSYKIKRKAVSSVRSDRFTHRFNAVQMDAEGKISLKVMCETSRSGELLVLELKPGNWKI